MASSDPELKEGFTLPVWMKTKPTKEFEPFAASPPAPDDSFFFIRYPGKETLFGKTKAEKDLQNILSNQTTELSAANYTYKEKDWSRHTKPCQDVIHGIAPISNVNLAAPTQLKTSASQGEFKGDGDACGSSVVKVANQMISSTRSPRGFTVASPSDDIDLESAEIQRHLAARRGSRSLPTSPNSSPTSRRKNTGNRYFTSPFEPVEESRNRSWLTMALLGFKKDLTTSTSTLAEEDVVEARLQGSLAESVENFGPAPKGVPPKVLSQDATQQPKLAKPANTFRPKPSELRELNFWSPTSM